MASVGVAEEAANEYVTFYAPCGDADDDRKGFWYEYAVVAAAALVAVAAAEAVKPIHYQQQQPLHLPTGRSPLL